MIGHDTTIRDWLEIKQRARSHDLQPNIKTPPMAPELKRRRDDSEERRMFRQLAGDEPIQQAA